MTDPAHTVRIATWNIFSGRRLDLSAVDLQSVADAIVSLDADVIALQEVDRLLPRTGDVAQVEAIAAGTGHHAMFAPALVGSPGTRWRPPDGHDSGGPAYGIALLTRTPPVRWRRLRLPGGGSPRPKRMPRLPGPGWDFESRVAIQAEIAIGSTVLTVTATHLSYMPWRAAHQLRALLPSAAQGTPAVLLGDLNLTPRPVGALTSQWVSAGGAPTYPADEPRGQIDHILCRGATPAPATTHEFGVSDHRALVTTVTIGGAGVSDPPAPFTT